MARDDTAREHETERSLLDRRSYLKMAGATAASLAATGVAASAGASSYDTITVPAGEQRRFTVGDGETFENKLIDITADGASAIITATANDFTIRNVAFKGVHPGQENFLKLCVPSGSATGLVENVYFGDGAVPGSKGGIYVMSSPAHRGELTFRNVHIAHISNNALYGSGPGYKGQPGVVHVEDSYFFSSNISNVRLGTAAATSHVRNCTIHVDDSVPGCQMNCSSPGAVNARGVWAWAGTVELHDCDIRTNDYGANLATRDGGRIVQNGSRIGADADVSPPESVPMSAEEAASGGSQTTDGSRSTNDGSTSTGSGSANDGSTGDSAGTLLELVSNPGTSAVEYEFTVDGAVRKRTTATDGGYVSENGDTVTDNGDGTVTVSGGVAGDGLGDAFVVEGSFVSMDVNESSWTLRYGGKEVTVADLTADDSTATDGGSTDALPNVVVFDGSNQPRRLAEYAFSVSGDVEKDAERGSVNAYDTASDGRATGRIVGGADAYRFSGSITDLRLEGAAVVEVHHGSQ